MEIIIINGDKNENNRNKSRNTNNSGKRNNSQIPLDCTIQSLLSTGEYRQYIQYKNKTSQYKKTLKDLGIKDQTMIMFKYWEDNANNGGKHIFQFKVNKLEPTRYRTGITFGPVPPMYELQLTGKILDKQTGRLKETNYKEAGFPTENEFQKWKDGKPGFKLNINCNPKIIYPKKTDKTQPYRFFRGIFGTKTPLCRRA